MINTIPPPPHRNHRFVAFNWQRCAHVLLFLKIRTGRWRVAIVMPERAQLPVDKDVKAFKKYMDNLRRKWVTFFFPQCTRSLIISFQGIDRADPPIPSPTFQGNCIDSTIDRGLGLIENPFVLGCLNESFSSFFFF